MTLAPPSSDVEALAERVRVAARAGESLRVVGAGTWLDAAAPVAASEPLSVRDLTGVVEYVPGDLTITVRAGTTLEDVDRITREQGQWLTLDPYGSRAGTIGATIATASAGPLATSFGTPRDVVLGLEAVLGTGTIMRAGGRVVKNVAGFDLVRLLCGSWGTLGVITEATLRLRALPEREETLATGLEDAPSAVQAFRAAMRDLPFNPLACEVLNGALAAKLGLGDGAVALTRLGGNPDALGAQRAAVQALGETSVVDPAIWERLRTAEGEPAAVVRLSHLPSRVGELWAASREIARRWAGTRCQASIARGVLRCVLPRRDPGRGGAANAVASALYIGVEATRSFERLPGELWSAIGPRLAPESIELRVKRAFDPGNVLNPGIMGVVG
ncbi:MAG TPA: FAD-binding oxidoreductase [Gemmatimonadaceae bacterium]|nr:FAD-binding oxidoreductase [Gemmatimonadaceae bacterium]